MLNLYYDSENGSFSYIQYDSENSLIELFYTAAEVISQLAANGGGSLEDDYDRYLEKLIQLGIRDDIEPYLTTILSANIDQLFLNGETKEEAARHMAYTFKDMMPEEAQQFCAYYDMSQEEFEKELQKNFIDNMLEVYNVDVTSVFEEIYDYEDDLF